MPKRVSTYILVSILAERRVLLGLRNKMWTDHTHSGLYRLKVSFTNVTVRQSSSTVGRRHGNAAASRCNLGTSCDMSARLVVDVFFRCRTSGDYWRADVPPADWPLADRRHSGSTTHWRSSRQLYNQFPPGPAKISLASGIAVVALSRQAARQRDTG